MPNLYAVAYLCPAHIECRRLEDLSESASAFYEAVAQDPFPHDVGDDPSFFSARYHNGPVTWGVCRSDVRGAIKDGDWVVFFAAVDRSENAKDYYLVAAQEVAEKEGDGSGGTPDLIGRRGRETYRHG